MGVVFWDVIEEHLDEAEFLWAQWERALGAHDDTLGGVEERIEERLFANVDGLVSGGEPVREKVLLPALEEAEGPARIAAAFALATSGPAEARARVIAKLGDPKARGDVERALGLATADGLTAALVAALHGDAVDLRSGALSVLAFRGEVPPLAPVLASDPDDVVIATLRSAALTGDRAQAALAKDALGAAAPEVRAAAIEAGLTLGLPEAWSACRKLVEGASAETPIEHLSRPLAWIAMGGDARDVELLVFALGLGPHRAAALHALGISGRAAAAEACLKWLDDRDSAPLAGDAFVAITGMPLDPSMSAPHDDADDTVARPLPRLGRDAVEAWWSQNQGRFHRTRRTLLGRPATFETIASVLATGPMRRRAPLAEELRIRSRGRARLETRAFTARQRAEMARLTAPALGFDQPF
ncbi:MAG: TIGR02270 family protein [Polyangiaceae bacterium]